VSKMTGLAALCAVAFVLYGRVIGATPEHSGRYAAWILVHTSDIPTWMLILAVPGLVLLLLPPRRPWCS